MCIISDLAKLIASLQKIIVDLANASQNTIFHFCRHNMKAYYVNSSLYRYALIRLCLRVHSLVRPQLCRGYYSLSYWDAEAMDSSEWKLRCLYFFTNLDGAYPTGFFFKYTRANGDHRLPPTISFVSWTFFNWSEIYKSWKEIKKIKILRIFL